eukprot:4710938-Lingulodinium_polyedra.AAC.1
MGRRSFLPSLSVDDIKAETRHRSKGELVLILFKQNMWAAVLSKGLLWFDHAPSTQEWIQEE